MRFRDRVVVVVLRKPISAKQAAEAVVVVGRQRIELVVVAATATDRHAQQRSAERLHDVVELFVPAALAFLLRLLRGERTGGEEPRGRLKAR